MAGPERSLRWIEAAEKIWDRMKQLSPGDMLPGELELADEVGVARGTVRRALQELESCGSLQRERGSGTRIVHIPAHPPWRVQHGITKDLLKVSDFRNQLRERGFSPKVQTLFLDRLPADDRSPQHTLARMELRLDAGSIFVLYSRLWVADETPIALHKAYVIPAAGEALLSSREEITNPETSLMGFYRERLNLIPVAVKQVIRAASPDDAEAQEAIEHGLEPPLLRVDQTSYGEDQRPFEFLRGYYGSQYSLSVNMGPVPDR